MAPTYRDDARGHARYDIGTQSAGNISNVGRDQYTAYVAHIQSQRDSFLREVAAARTKARWLLWLGVIGLLCGAGLCLWVMAGQFSAFQELWNFQGDPAGAEEAMRHAFDAGLGREVAGINGFILGMILSLIGEVLFVIGIVRHIIATARRKRVDRELAVPPPWTYPN